MGATLGMLAHTRDDLQSEAANAETTEAAIPENAMPSVFRLIQPDSLSPGRYDVCRVTGRFQCGRWQHAR